MARLQILELPTEHHGDDMVTPFVLVIDQAPNGMAGFEALRRDLEDSNITERAGARAVLVFEETIDIPANEITLSDAADGNTVRIRVEPDLTGFRERVEEEALYARGKVTRPLNPDGDSADALREQLDEARMWARHGYEIGQKHCGWSDHGVAPDWLTEGWPPHFDSCEHLKRAVDLEKAEDIRKRVSNEVKAALTDALGTDRLRDWDDIIGAARRLRRKSEEMGGQISRVRAAIKERRTEVTEFEAENKPSGWSDTVTVTCDRINDALRVFPPSAPVREPASEREGNHA